MTRIPEPDQTPAGPAFEGRLLDRADEPVVDQGAAFDLRTLVSRRGVLSLVGLGLGAATLTACAAAVGASGSSGSASSPGTSSGSAGSTTGSSSALPAGEIPEETAGPYPGDGSNGPDILEQSGIVRSDIRTSLDGRATAEGVPTTIRLTVLDMANGDAPFEGGAVYVWHANASGEYSMYSPAIEDETYLRGVQEVGADGVVSFTSIFPACYDGRWPHIHFEVYPDVDSITDSSNAIATSQVALPEATCTQVYSSSLYSGSSANLAKVSLETDGVFGDDGGALELGTVTGDTTTGLTVALTVRVDTTTQAGGGTISGGLGGSGGPGGSGTPGN